MTTLLFLFLILSFLNPCDAETKGSWTDFTGTFRMYGASSFSYVTGTVTWSWTQSKMLLSFTTGTSATWSETYDWNSTRGFTGAGTDAPQYLFTLGSSCAPNCNSASMSSAMPLLNPSGPSLGAGVAGTNGCYTYTPVASGSSTFLTSLSASSTQVCSFTLTDGRTFVMTSFTNTAATITNPSGCSCTQAVDIQFLIDHSLSISNAQMGEFKKFVTNFIAGLTISPTAVNVGASYFSLPAQSGSNWPMTGTPATVASGMAGWAVPCATGSNQCQGAGTATGHGIRIAADALYLSQRQVPKILMTLTDGATNRNKDGNPCCSGSDQYTGCNPDIDSAIAYLKSKKAAQTYAHNLTLIAAGIGTECTTSNKQQCATTCKYSPHLLKFADGISSNVLSVTDWSALQTQVSNLMSLTCTTSNNVAQQTCLLSCPGLCVCGACVAPTGCTNNLCFNYTLVGGVCQPTPNACPSRTCQQSTCDSTALNGNGQCQYSATSCTSVTSGCNGCTKFTCAQTGSTIGQCTVPDSSACPPAVDCVFNDWSGWTTCTASCGGGTTVATRTVKTQASGCGAACSLSPTSTTVTCNGQTCATPCTVGDWGGWGACSVSCGGGTQISTRSITAAATNGGAGCPPLSQSQICGSTNCPINCSWYDWGDWSTCTTTCGTGSTTQQRFIKVQAAYGGAACSGSGTNTTVCSTNGCPVSCFWSLWGAYGQCSRSCGQGTQTRTRTESPPASNGGDLCPESNSYTQNCTVVECPINCTWGDWTGFSVCTKSCGTGTATQTRSVAQPPLYGGASCPGSGTNTTACNTLPCPIDCVWNAWNDWTGCSKSCGGGTRYTNRTNLPALYNGVSCTGAYSVVEPCNTQGCPVNCSWSAWDAWTGCSLSCGGGTTSQYRTVSVPMQNLGFDCNPAENVNTTACNTQDCPVDCVWSAWDAWTNCSLTCGGGTQTANRSVTTTPNLSGIPCGPLNQTSQTCNTFYCPIDCVGDFGNWTVCNCNTSDHERTFAISRPAQYGGANCSNETGYVQTEHCVPSLVDGCNPVHCTGSWGNYSTCSCVTNDQFRFYSVTTPASNNGTECPNATGTKETTSCTPTGCPVDCSGYWTEKTNCTCIGHTQTQTYIQNVTVLNGGVSCPFSNGTVNTTTGCDPLACPVDCVGQWTVWDTCSCNTSSQNRTFVITTPIQYAGKDCLETDGTVKNQSCTPVDCPVDCAGFYSGWSVCSCTTNTTSRLWTRTQDALFFGNDCNSTNGGTSPPVPEVDACTPVDCPVDCSGDWSDWGNCSCSSSQSNRSYTLTRASAHGGTGCPATNGQIEFGSCIPIDCPVPCDGSWTQWGGSCDCSSSTKERTFMISSAELNGGAPCLQVNNTIDSTGCTPTGCPVNCQGGWGGWSTCSCVTKDRTRAYTVFLDQQNDGLNCSNATGDEEVVSCSPTGCPVNCDGEWTNWTSCPCGTEEQTRSFTPNVTVANGGQVCPQNQTQQCTAVGCAVNCSGVWSEWSTCSCRSKTHTRTFTVRVNQSNGGKNCEAPNKFIGNASCVPTACAVNCTGSWSSWSKCSCKDRIHTRTFKVTVNQSNGGKNCDASDKYVGNGACNPTGCDTRPVCNSTADCIDSSACTQNLCLLNVSDGQYHCDWSQPVVCRDNSVCTSSDTCDEIKGCVYIDLDCNDNNACTNDFCSNTTGCYHTNVTCTVNASEFCSTPICDVTTGCNSIQRVCPGEAKDNCTQKICNPKAASASVACVDVQLCGFDPVVAIGIAGGAIAGIAVATASIALAAASGASYAIATQTGAMVGATVIESPLYVGDGASGVNMLPQ